MNLLFVLHFIAALPWTLFGRREPEATTGDPTRAGSVRSCRRDRRALRLGNWPSWHPRGLNLEWLFSRFGLMRAGLVGRAAGSLWPAAMTGSVRWRKPGWTWRMGRWGRLAQPFLAHGLAAAAWRPGDPPRRTGSWRLTGAVQRGRPVARLAASPPCRGSSGKRSPAALMAGRGWSWLPVAPGVSLNCFSR